MNGRDLLVRLFNAAASESEHEIAFGVPLKRVETVELDGAARQRLDLRRSQSGQHAVRVAIPHLGFKTLRLFDMVNI